MAMLRATAFDGHAVNGATDVQVLFMAQDRYALGSSVAMTSHGAGPLLVESISSERREVPVRARLADDAAMPLLEFDRAIKEWFDPQRNHAGPRWLTVTGDDSLEATPVALRLPVYVTSLEPRPRTVGQYDIILQSARQHFEAATETSAASSPASVAGTAATRPRIELTTTNHVSRNRYTVTPVAANPAITGYICRVTQSGIEATNHAVFVNGVEAETRCPSSAVLYFPVDATLGSPAIVDVLWGAGVTARRAQQLAAGGLNLPSTNPTRWAWNAWDTLVYPDRPGVWRPGLYGTAWARNDGTASTSGGCDLVSSAANTTISLRVGQPPEYVRNNANAIYLIVGARAITTNALANLSRVTSGWVDSSGQAFVAYRTAGSPAWVDAWTTMANATVTTSLNVPNAAQIVAGVRYTGAAPAATPITMQLALSGTGVTLDLQSTPAITQVGSTVTMDLYAGSLTVAGRTISLPRVIAPDGTLRIDAATDDISSSVAGPIYHLEAPSFTDGANWALLTPGSNVFSHTFDSAAMTLFWRAGYV